MINHRFNVIIIINMIIMLMNVEVPLIIWKDKLTILKRKIKKNLPCYILTYNGESEEKTLGVLAQSK